MAGGKVSLGPDGGFTATVPGPGTYTFSYKAKNSQGTESADGATVTLNFPEPSGLHVTLVDGKTKAAVAPQDYRWIIEEDRTWYQNPNCTTNPHRQVARAMTAGIVPAYGTNFHTSHMPVVAQGCTGEKSCEFGQSSSYGVRAAACDVGNGICRTDASEKSIVLPGEAVLDPNKRYYISVFRATASMGPRNGRRPDRLSRTVVGSRSRSSWNPCRSQQRPFQRSSSKMTSR